MTEASQRRPLLPWVAAVAALVAGLALGALLGPRVLAPAGRASPAAPATPRLAAAAGCLEQSCQVGGQPGRCVRGECIAAEGRCTSDGDCDDGNPCTRDACEAGRCTLGVGDGACRTASGVDGICLEAICHPAARVACAYAAECPPQPTGCAEPACLDGRCSLARRPKGAACTTAAGRTGLCQGAVCVAAPGDGATEVCAMEWDPYLGDVRRCRIGLRFRVPVDELAKGEERLEQIASQVLRYDLAAAFVELPDGGYNLVLRPRRPTSELRGVIDPALTAWLASAYAAQSGWRARQAVLWVGEGGAGWSAPTRGGDASLQPARDRGPAFGLGGAEAYRTWLESSMVRLAPRPAPASSTAPQRP